MRSSLPIVWYFAEKNSHLNEVKRQKAHDDNAEDIQIVDTMSYEQCGGETRCVLTSYSRLSRAFQFISELMIELSLSDEIAHQIIIAIIRLFN